MLIDRVLAVMSHDPRERFLQLQSLLPPIYWTNSFLPLLSLLINHSPRCWHSMVAFAPSLVSIGGDLFAFVMERIMSRDVNQLIADLLLSILHSRVSECKNCVTVLVSLVERFLNFGVLYKCCKTFGNSAPLINHLDSASEKQCLLHGHPMSDLIFGHNLPWLSNASAIGQFFLGNYAEAINAFGVCPTPFEQRISSLLHSIGPIGNYFAPLKQPVIDHLTHALFSLRSGVSVDAALELDACEKAALENFRSHLSPTLYEKHRLFTIIAAISLIRQTFTGITVPRLSVNDYYESCSLLPIFRGVLIGLRMDLLPVSTNIAKKVINNNLN
jgi:hypothetical protein